MPSQAGSGHCGTSALPACQTDRDSPPVPMGWHLDCPGHSQQGPPSQHPSVRLLRQGWAPSSGPMAMMPQPAPQALDKICLQRAKVCQWPCPAAHPSALACVPVTCPLLARSLERAARGTRMWRAGTGVVDRLGLLSCWLLCAWPGTPANALGSIISPSCQVQSIAHSRRTA